MRPLPLAFSAILTFIAFTASSQTLQVATGNPAYPWIAVGSTRIAVAWQEDGGRVDAAVLDFAGNIVTPPFTVGAAAEEARPRVAAVGDMFLVAWFLVTGERKGDVRAALFDSNGVARPAVTLAASIEPCSVVVGGNLRFLVSWPEGGGSLAAWVNEEGVVESTFPLVDNAHVTDVAVRPDGAMAAWSSADSVACGVTAIGSAGAQESRQIASMPTTVPGDEPAITSPAIAWNGAGYYLAWITGLPGLGNSVEGTRLLPDGTPLDVVEANRTRTKSGASSLYYDLRLKGQVHVATVRDRFLVSWMQDTLNDAARASYVEPDGRHTGIIRPIPDPARIGAYATTTTLPDGTPISVYTRNGALEVDYFRAGPRRRAVR